MPSKSTISADFCNVLGRNYYLKLTLATLLTASENHCHTALLAITLNIFQDIIVVSVIERE